MSFNLTAGNPCAHRVRVYYLNASSATIYEGMPLCYKDDTTTNWFGGSMSVGAVTASTSLTAGTPATASAKYLEVEAPGSDNLQWFAGVVAAGGWCGKADARALDIYVPNGAIVPVRAGVDCTESRTVLSVITGTNYLGHALSANQARPVAVTEETVARSTAGLILAKLDPNIFIYQDNTGEALYVGTGATVAAAAQAVNRINISSAQTAGRLRLLECVGTLTSTGDTEQGMVQFRCISDGIPTGLLQTVSIRLDFDDDGGIEVDPGAYHYANCALHIGLDTIDTATPDFSAGSATNILCAVAISYTCDESGGEPDEAWVFYFNSHPDYQWDGLICQIGPGMIGDSDHAGTASKVVGFDGDGDIRKIPVKLYGPGGQVYYILAGTAMAEVDSD